MPQGNAMNLAQPIALFLSLYAAVHGPGAKVAFPGTQAAYDASRHTDVAQDVLARFTLFVSLQARARVAQRSFNIGDSDGGVTWGELWPGLAAYFGLEGVPPSAAAAGEPLGVEWVNANKERWGRWEEEAGVRKGVLESTGWWFFDWLSKAELERYLDLGEARALGWEESQDTVKSFHDAFDKLKEAGVIPKTATKLDL